MFSLSLQKSFWNIKNNFQGKSKIFCWNIFIGLLMLPNIKNYFYNIFKYYSLSPFKMIIQGKKCITLLDFICF